MPLYEYECTKCGCRTEARQKVGDPLLTKCKKCGGSLRKLISSSAIQFKGSGWYITDYAKKSSPHEEPKAKDNSPAKKPCTPESGSDDKPKTDKKTSTATKD